MKENIIVISDLVQFKKFLMGEEIINSGYYDDAIYYVEDANIFILDQSKIRVYRKAPSLTGARFIFDMKLLEAMSNNYIPIVDKDTKENLFDKEEFLLYRRKMSGLSEYGTGDYIFSDNLYFEGLDYYLNLIDANKKEVSRRVEFVNKEVQRVIESLGLTVSFGCNSGGDVELVEAGSTSRYTNVPSSDNSSKWDFDFTVRMNPEIEWLIKEDLETKLEAKGHITRTSRHKVRLLDVTIPGLDMPVDLDFSLTPQKRTYLSTEEALIKRLDKMHEQDDLKYRLVLANIMYAKDMLKKAGSYKAARSLEFNREYGGIGAVGIENWILQNGGSFIDASKDFLKYADLKEFIDFEKEYAIMDFGQDHVSTTKGEFPYHNFVMRNMRYKGFEVMRDTLHKFLNCLEEEKERQR